MLIESRPAAPSEASADVAACRLAESSNTMPVAQREIPARSMNGDADPSRGSCLGACDGRGMARVELVCAITDAIGMECEMSISA